MKRDWADAIRAHAGEACRVCGTAGRRCELAHTIGRTFDQPRNGKLYVHPLSVVTLCGPPTDTGTCHARFDGHRLDLRPFLTVAELDWAVQRVGHGQAMRRLAGRDWQPTP